MSVSRKQKAKRIQAAFDVTRTFSVSEAMALVLNAWRCPNCTGLVPLGRACPADGTVLQ